MAAPLEEEATLLGLIAVQGGSPSPVSRKATGPADDKPKPAHYEGHRQRLRQRFRQAGGEALPDYELMELILFRAIPRRDVKPIAKKLIDTFGSFAEAIGACPTRLCEIGGVSEAVVTELKIVHACAVRLAQGKVRERPVLASWSHVLAYLRTAMAFESREHVRVLFLDKRNLLIADELQSKGTVDHTPVYIREVVKRALELSASAIILAHNHPSGDPAPSRDDITTTKELSRLAAGLGILVHDHVVVGKEGTVSLRQTGLFEPDTPIILDGK